MRLHAICNLYTLKHMVHLRVYRGVESLNGYILGSKCCPNMARFRSTHCRSRDRGEKRCHCQAGAGAAVQRGAGFSLPGQRLARSLEELGH